jgi:MFS family permease
MPPTNARYVFLTYAAALSLILYLDRICISKSAASIQAEFGLDKAQIGWIFTAFTLGYTLFEIPSGSWGDRFGPKRVLCRIVLWWSLFTVLTGCIWPFTWDSGYFLEVPWLENGVPLLVDGFLLFLLVRFFFGVGEAGAYPNIAKSSARWFPLGERGRAQGIVATAGRVGGGIAAGVTIFVTSSVDVYLWPGMGWRVTFWIFGGLGVAWGVLFARWFRNSPAEHPSVNAAELALIEGYRDMETRRHTDADHGHGSPKGAPWRFLLTSVNLWTFSIMAFCSAFVVYLYFTHFPDYLKERHHFPEAGLWVAGLPLLAGALGCTLGGILTDWLVLRTGSKRWGRRIMGLGGKGGGALLLLAGVSVDDPVLAVTLISLAAFTSDLAVAAHWAVCTDTGGRFVGTVFGIMNMVAGLGAALSPVLAGYILEALSPTGSAGTFDAAARARAWDVVLYLFAGTLAVCALCWLRIDAEESVVGAS